MIEPSIWKGTYSPTTTSLKLDNGNAVQAILKFMVCMHWSSYSFMKTSYQDNRDIIGCSKRFMNSAVKLVSMLPNITGLSKWVYIRFLLLSIWFFNLARCNSTKAWIYQRETSPFWLWLLLLCSLIWWTMLLSFPFYPSWWKKWILLVFRRAFSLVRIPFSKWLVLLLLADH